MRPNVLPGILPFTVLNAVAMVREAGMTDASKF
jgi:hypothetical protein